MGDRQIEIFQSSDGQAEVAVHFTEDTVWLTQAQIAELFEVKPQNITMHLKHAFVEGELTEKATCKESLQVQTEGTRQVKRKRKRKQYNLDAIICSNSDVVIQT